MGARWRCETSNVKREIRGEDLDIPQGFLERMRALLGDEFGAFAASYGAAPVAGLRVNTLKVSAEAFRAAAPFDLTSTPWCPAGFTLPDEQAAGKHPWHAAGLYYLQEPSAMAVAELLDPQPGERVLDLAAAPGGKATHIAALMAGQGLLIANELHPKRAWILAENLERWGAGHIAITNEPPERLAARFAGFFDRVLLDAPCSGEGMFRKSAAARQEWSPALVLGCAQRQSLILEHAARLVRPGGRLVYSTCAFAPEEDEAVIARFLEERADFDLIAPPRRPGFSPGRPDWVDSRGGFSVADAASRYGSSLTTGTAPSKPENPPLRFAVRLWPHTGPGEGHFIAVLQRRAAAADLALSPKPWRSVPLPRPVAAAYRAFCAANLAQPPAADRLALVGSYLYALPHDLPDLTGLRFLHPGWWLGVMKKERFEPSHALALRLRPADALRCADQPAGSPDGLSHLPAYLRGEGFRSPGEDGWTLVAADGFAVGWGKRVGGMLKSHYPKGLRWN
ncbi:MAG: hypothetical protein QG637_899 [Chloroflexota bacterium]|nr:hypothetical protein [Chloroflexota bacterium]